MLEVLSKSWKLVGTDAESLRVEITQLLQQCALRVSDLYRFLTVGPEGRALVLTPKEFAIAMRRIGVSGRRGHARVRAHPCASTSLSAVVPAARTLHDGSPSSRRERSLTRVLCSFRAMPRC